MGIEINQTRHRSRYRLIKMEYLFIFKELGKLSLPYHSKETSTSPDAKVEHAELRQADGRETSMCVYLRETSSQLTSS